MDSLCIRLNLIERLNTGTYPYKIVLVSFYDPIIVFRTTVARTVGKFPTDSFDRFKLTLHIFLMHFIMAITFSHFYFLARFKECNTNNFSCWFWCKAIFSLVSKSFFLYIRRERERANCCSWNQFVIGVHCGIAWIIIVRIFHFTTFRCTVVLFNSKKLSQAYLLNTSRKAITAIAYSQCGR